MGNIDMIQPNGRGRTSSPLNIPILGSLTLPLPLLLLLVVIPRSD
jgi:hypothetical protein